MSIYKQRINAVQEYIKQTSADGFFITNSFNIFYLTGFQGLSPEERESTLFITSADATLFLPRMYQEQGKMLQSVREKQVICVVDHERDGLLTKWIKAQEKGQNILIEEGDLTIEEYDYLKKVSGFSFHTSGGYLEGLRIRKDSVELGQIRTVVARTDQVFNDLISALKKNGYTTYTELDIADTLRTLGRKYDLNSFSFDPIVACGPGSSEPHYVTSNKKLKKGEVLLMDFGFTLNGYHSDLTRTIFLGKAPEKVKDMYDIVLACNEYALQLTRPGIDAGLLHQKSVEFFAKQKLDTYFIHGLGHGVGLEVHEEPFFRINRKTILQPGMTVTIEPGLYFPNEYGIRIEDYVVVTERGVEVLSNKSPKKLIELL